MARYISIDVDSHGLLVVAGSAHRDKLTVERLIAATDLAQPLTAANAEMLGARLKQLLKEAKIAPAPALVVLGRERIILKDVRHPPVPPADEPGVIRFAASKEIADGIDDMVFDYSPLPTSLNATEKRATVSFVKKDIIAAVRTLCDAAGLKLAAITPRPYAAVAALAHAAAVGAAPPPEPADGPVAVVVVHEAGGEFSVCRNGVITFTRTISAAAVGSEASLIAELRRDLAISSGQAGSDVQAIYVAEADLHGEGWSGRLRSALGLPVYAFDPLANLAAAEAIPAALHGRFVGPIGLLCARGQAAVLAINFVQPRQPRNTEGNPLRKRALAASLLAAMLFVALGVGSYLLVDASESKVASLKTQIAAKEKGIEECSLDAKRLTAVNEYMARNVVWLDEFYEQVARYYEMEKKGKRSEDIVNKARMIHFEGTAAPLPTEKERQAEAAKAAANNASPKKAATLTMTLAAERVDVASEMVASLTRDSRFYPNAKAPRAGSAVTGAGAAKQQTFIIDTGVVHRTATDYVHKLVVTLPKAVEEPKIAEEPAKKEDAKKEEAAKTEEPAKKDEAGKKDPDPLPDTTTEEQDEKPGESKP